MDLSFLYIFKDSYQTFINIFIIVFIAFFGWKTLSAIIKKKLDGLDNSKESYEDNDEYIYKNLIRIFENI